MLWVMGVGVILTILRYLLPVEFPEMQNVHLPKLFSKVFHWMRMPLWGNILPVNILLFLWCAGSVFLLCRLARKLWEQIGSFYRVGVSPSDRLCKIYEELLAELGCRKKGALLMSSYCDVARCVGFLRPDIFIPESMEEMPEKHIRYILKHEMTHYLRHDLWWRTGLEVLRCLLWWNPAVYLLDIYACHLMELRCDCVVCKELPQGEILDYAQILYDTFQNVSAKKTSPISMGYLGYSKDEQVKQRFSLICDAAKLKVPKRRWTSFALLVVLVGMFIGSYTVTFQTGGYPSEEELGTAVVNYEDDSNYIMRHPDGKLEVFIDHQLYGAIRPEQLEEEPFSSMLIVDIHLGG